MEIRYALNLFHIYNLVLFGAICLITVEICKKKTIIAVQIVIIWDRP